MVFPFLSHRERKGSGLPAVSPVYGGSSTLATTGVSDKGRRMPMQPHVVRMVFLVLCLSMLTLQNGCSNSGSGQAEAPASNANAVNLALSTTTGSTAVEVGNPIPIRIRVTNGSGA